MINTQRLLDNFKAMVALDSPSLNERLVCDYIKNYLKNLGIEAEEDDAGTLIGGTAGNLHAYIPGDIDAAPLLFSAHTDTVEPSHGKQAIVHEDGTITSAGDTVLGSDDLAGVSSILEALTVILENGLPHRPIELLFTVCEEKHGGGAGHMDYGKINAKQAYVFDMDGAVGTAAVAAPTIFSYQVTFIGKAAHAGFAAHLGVHAIKAAAHAVCEIPCGAVGEGITANVGVIHGGKATNIVPDACTIEGEIRCFCDDDADKEFAKVKAICENAAQAVGARIEYTAQKSIIAFSTPEEGAVIQRFKRCCKALSLSGETYPTFGGSDNNVFAQQGIEGIVVATAMNNCHAVNEYTSVSELEKAASLALALMSDKED